MTKEGDKYEGYWLNDLMHGLGKYTDDFGSTYYGIWQNNQKGSLDPLKPGYGVSTELNGDKEPCDVNNGTYEGQWACNQKWGQGKFTYTTGTIYNGGWINGKKHY